MRDYLSVAETAQRFKISNRRVQLLCEQGRIENAKMISGVWVIPASAQKPHDGRKRAINDAYQMSLFDTDIKPDSLLLTFEEVCAALSISPATGRNWVKLGKIVPEDKSGRTLMFSRGSVDNILQDIAKGESKALSRRRNKKKISGVSAYESYISCSHNIDYVNHIVKQEQDKMPPAFLRSILANAALQFYCQKNGMKNRGNLINEYLQGKFSAGYLDIMIDDLLGDKSELNTIDFNDQIFALEAEYMPGEDTLGFIYISLTNLGERKASGTYYTPLTVVGKLVTHLSNTTRLSGRSIFDPCCGSGNFLLAIGEHTAMPELIYGQDIDLTAVQLARISFALKYDVKDINFLYSHFTCADTLDVSSRDTFEIVLGNPPWGGELSKERLTLLAQKYKTAVKNGTETYDLFIERGLSLLSEGGILAFVLPEAVLNVAAHTNIREILLSRCNFKFVQYLGNVFSGVQCPSIILGAEKTIAPKAGITTVCSDKNNASYSIHSNRQITADRFNFHVRDEAQDCLDALQGNPDFCTLSGKAKFALGIVTGDNASYTSAVCLDGYEPVLKGSDIRKYRFEAGGTYIRFVPQNFQQVAPAELYRAPEKLLYRFICETLVFAYDNNQILSLNSCNILIPQIPNLSIKYILAILNSRAAAFYFINMFNSVKVLRSHLEQIPIPSASAGEQKNIIGLTDKIIEQATHASKIYDELDDNIMSLYGLDSAKRQTLTRALAGRNLFLV